MEDTVLRSAAANKQRAVDNLINTLNNLPASGGSVHRRAQILQMLKFSYRLNSKEQEEVNKKAHDFIIDFFSSVYKAAS